jgi:opacity protein-like surface antigen
LKKCLSAALVAAVIVAIPAAAQASTMPKADFGSRPTLGIGAGNGLGVSLDFPVSSAFSIGLGANLVRFNAADIDLRLLYKLTHVDRLEVDLLGGVDALGFGGTPLFGPFIGVALAMPFTPQFVGRLNLAANVLNFGALDAAGIEIGYKFSPSLEGTLGYNGRGDAIGLKMTF